MTATSGRFLTDNMIECSVNDELDCRSYVIVAVSCSPLFSRHSRLQAPHYRLTLMRVLALLTRHIETLQRLLPPVLFHISRETRLASIEDGSATSNVVALSPPLAHGLSLSLSYFRGGRFHIANSEAAFSASSAGSGSTMPIS